MVQSQDWDHLSPGRLGQFDESYARACTLPKDAQICRIDGQDGHQGEDYLNNAQSNSESWTTHVTILIITFPMALFVQKDRIIVFA
jgi:hypothetical protein